MNRLYTEYLPGECTWHFFIYLLAEVVTVLVFPDEPDTDCLLQQQDVQEAMHM